MFDLDLDLAVSWVKKKGYRSVAIQLPEGLKLDAFRISDILKENTGIDTTILGDPCYGACDLFLDYRKYADALIHFGHSPIHPQENDGDILFIEVRADADIEDALTELSERLPKKIGLLATVQYVGLISKAKKILEDKGKEVLIGKGDDRIFYPGQVLGCNCSAASEIEDEAEVLLYLGEGDFHPLAASFGTEKEVIVLNPLSGEVRSMNEKKERMLRKRFALIESAKSAESFLIIVCIKTGQDRSGCADRIADLAAQKGKKAYRVVMNEISPDALLPYKADAYINTACPRIAMDDSARYSKPMLTVTEAEIALGLREWDKYEFDEICSERTD